MIQTVLKRDGRVVGFNEEKIATAIRKAMLHTDKGEDLQPNGYTGLLFL